MNKKRTELKQMVVDLGKPGTVSDEETEYRKKVKAEMEQLYTIFSSPTPWDHLDFIGPRKPLDKLTEAQQKEIDFLLNNEDLGVHGELAVRTMARMMRLLKLSRWPKN